jgi:hypothetical protein
MRRQISEPFPRHRISDSKSRSLSSPSNSSTVSAKFDPAPLLTHPVQRRIHLRLWRLQARRHSPYLPIPSHPRPHPERHDSPRRPSSPHTRCHSQHVPWRRNEGVLQGPGNERAEDPTRDVHHVCGVRELGVGVQVISSETGGEGKMKGEGNRMDRER